MESPASPSARIYTPEAKRFKTLPNSQGNGRAFETEQLLDKLWDMIVRIEDHSNHTRRLVTGISDKQAQIIAESQVAASTCSFARTQVSQIAATATKVSEGSAVVIQALEKVHARLAEIPCHGSANFASKTTQIESLVREREAIKLENQNMQIRLQRCEAANNTMLQALQQDRMRLQSTMAALQWYQNAFGHLIPSREHPALPTPRTSAHASQNSDMQPQNEQLDNYSVTETRGG